MGEPKFKQQKMQLNFILISIMALASALPAEKPPCPLGDKSPLMKRQHDHSAHSHGQGSQSSGTSRRGGGFSLSSLLGRFHAGHNHGGFGAGRGNGASNNNNADAHDHGGSSSGSSSGGGFLSSLMNWSKSFHAGHPHPHIGPF